MPILAWLTLVEGAIHDIKLSEKETSILGTGVDQAALAIPVTSVQT
jgi:hypothetical protein